MDALEFLYNTIPGRLVLRPLIGRHFSAFFGALMDSPASKSLIPHFIKKYRINTAEFETGGVRSFNDFFCRRIKPGARPVCGDADALVAPCDGLLSVCPIKKGTVIKAKQSRFTIASMLRDKKLAKSFEGGYCLVYRLCVNDLHRYIYFDSGYKHRDRRIDGFFHTVRPVALKDVPVFTENSRRYCVLDTHSFGRCVQMEVGAMLVGRIVNHHPAGGEVKRGSEKGFFEYGGSTVIVLIPGSDLSFREEVKAAMAEDREIFVRQGEWVARKNPV